VRGQHCLNVKARRLSDVISHFKPSGGGASEHTTALRKTTSAMSVSRHAAQPVRLIVNGRVAKENEVGQVLIVFDGLT
jgi:hypothetical protein